MVFEFGCDVNSDGYKGSTTGYQAFTVENLISENGNVSVDLEDMDITYNSYYFEIKDDEGYTRNFSTRGYETLDELFKDLVTSNLDKYEYEASDSLK